MKRGIYGALITAGLICALGVAGGSDAELLSVTAINRGLVISITLMAIGIYGAWLEDARAKTNERIKMMKEVRRDAHRRYQEEDAEEVPGRDGSTADCA